MAFVKWRWSEETSLSQIVCDAHQQISMQLKREPIFCHKKWSAHVFHRVILQWLDVADLWMLFKCKKPIIGLHFAFQCRCIAQYLHGSFARRLPAAFSCAPTERHWLIGLKSLHGDYQMAAMSWQCWKMYGFQSIMLLRVSNNLNLLVHWALSSFIVFRSQTLSSVVKLSYKVKLLSLLWD